jgi:hypothetical protein
MRLILSFQRCPKVIDRWSPRRGVEYNIGKYLIKLSGEKIDNLY